MTLHVRHDGPPDAPPLLLIHGSAASGLSWGPVVPALAEEHHVIRVDLAGHGQSPPAASYDVPVQARRVAAVLDGLGLREVAVATHSAGGYPATSLAEQRPDLVTSLALISCGPSPDAFRRQPVVLRLLLAPPFGPLLWPVRSDATTRRAIAATCARPVDIPDDVLADSRRVTYRVLRAVSRRNTAFIAERTVPERLAGLGVPVLAVFGADDPRWHASSVRQYAAVPGARIEMLPGVGHVPMFESPDAVGELLLRFTRT